MDKDALVKIFDLYSSVLYRYALRLCSDPVMADHIVGDVFAKLLDQLALGNGPRENLRSYLYEMTYHQVIDETRDRHHSVPLEVTHWLRQDAKDTLLSLEDQALFKQLLHAIRHVLTDDQRHVIILRFLEEFSIRETAAILGKRADHVRVIQNRAIVALRKFFKYQEILKAGSPPRLEAALALRASLGVITP